MAMAVLLLLVRAVPAAASAATANESLRGTIVKNPGASFSGTTRKKPHKLVCILARLSMLKTESCQACPPRSHIIKVLPIRHMHTITTILPLSGRPYPLPRR